MVLLVLLLLFLTPSFFNTGSPAVWKANVLAVQFTLWSHFTRGVEAIPPIEKQKEVKEKIKKGQTLVEELNTLLEEIKGKLQKGGNVDKASLSQAINLKDSFKQCKLQSDDLPTKLIDDFKKKIMETFVMILMNENTAQLLNNVQKEQLPAQQVHNDLSKHNVEEL